MTATPYAPAARPGLGGSNATSSPRPAGTPSIRGTRASAGLSRETVVALALLPFLAGGGFVLGGQLFADPAPTASAVSSAHTTDAPHVLPSTAPTAAAPVAPAAPAPVAPAAPAPVAPAAPAPVAPAPAPAPVAVTSGAPVPAAGPAASFGRGASGEDVRRWQVRMAERGWAITVDGVFGAESAAVARRFQAEKGLAVDGVVGPRTWAAAWDLPVTPS